MHLNNGLRIIKIIIIIFFIPSTIFTQKVKVGIVGYTLLNEFRIVFDQESTITLDGQELDIDEAIIFRDGFINYLGNEKKFTHLGITGGKSTLFLSNKGPQPYSGDFEILYNNSLQIINCIDIDNYFSSVLASELGDHYHEEALKAQLLAIKEFYYIRKERNINNPWHILNTSRVMAYRGQEFETAIAMKIVKKLKKTRLKLKDGIEPMFFSTASGYILKQECMSSGIYNQPVDPILLNDNNTDSPYYSFEIAISKDDLIKIFNMDFEKLSLYYYKDTPLVDFVIFSKENVKDKYLKGYEFVSKIQRRLGSQFRSIQFSFHNDNDIYSFKGNGFGHFIGLSQYGAQSMAEEGSDYKAILLHYYPGSTIINPVN